MMRAKSAICENLTRAYKSNNREMLEKICSEYVPDYQRAIETLSDAHAYHKDTYLRSFGTELMDAEYGRMKERARTLKRRLGAYLEGKIDAIEEIEEKKLAYQWGIFF